MSSRALANKALQTEPHLLAELTGSYNQVFFLRESYLRVSLCCFWRSIVSITSINHMKGFPVGARIMEMRLKWVLQKKKKLPSWATGSELLYVHYRGELQQRALRPNAAAFRVQLLQILQEASPLETLKNDGVAGGQADAGPATERREQRAHEADIHSQICLLEQGDVLTRPICPPTYRGAQRGQCQRRSPFFPFDYNLRI